MPLTVMVGLLPSEADPEKIDFKGSCVMRSLPIAKLRPKSLDRALLLIASVLVVAIIMVARY
jgi:hypothetical protein